MQDQIVKKFKDSLNKSSESYQNQNNQLSGGMNNIPSNYNSNTNQINSDITNSQLLQANYLSNKLKNINSGQVHQNLSDFNKQKTEITNIVGVNLQEHSNLKLTNKLTQNIKDYYNENAKPQDVSNQKEFIQKFQEYSSDKNISKFQENQDINYNDDNECERLGTELVDEEDINNEDNNYLIQKEYVELINQERLQQFKKQGQQNSQINDQQLQEQIHQQQQLLQQQQQLGELQPGDFRIEIENRYYKSQCNRTFKFPRNLDKENKRKYNYDTEYNSSNDSSLHSVDGVTVYNLHAQNMKNYQREYMEMQEQTNDQMEKFKIQEQLRLQKEEEEIIEKERIQHQLRQQKMIQQQVYIQHQQVKHNQEKKSDQMQQLREQLQTQQSAHLQIQKQGGIDLSQVIKTEAYDKQSVGKNSIHSYLKNQQSQQVKNIIDLTQHQNQQINQQHQDQINKNINNNINQYNQAQYQLQQQQIASQKMKLSSSTENQNNKQKQQLQKFKNMIQNKQQQQQIQKNNKLLPHENSRRMKTEGNDIDFEQNSYNHHLIPQKHNHTQHQNIHNQHHKLYTEHHNFPTQNCEYFSNDEEDETIENFEDALQDGSDNDSGEIARLDDIKIQSYKQTISPPQNNIKPNQTIQNNTNQDTINNKNYKNLIEILEKNSKTSHSRQSTSVSNSNQIGTMNSNVQGHQKKNSHNSTLQTVQIQIQQQVNAAATNNPPISSVTKNMTYKSRPTTSQQNRNKNQYSSQNCSINIQSSNRNTIQVSDNLNTSKTRQQSKTSHSNYENPSLSTVGGVSEHVKTCSGVNISSSIEGASISSRQQSLLQTQKNLLSQNQGQANSRKRSTSNKNNTSTNMNTSSSQANNSKPMTNNSNSQKSNLKQIINYSKHLDNFKIDNIKSNQLKPREEKVSSKAPSNQNQMTGLLNSRSIMNSYTNNSFQMAKNASMNNGTQNKIHQSQNNQNAAKLKARNSNSFHQNMQSSNISSIHTSQTTNFNNKSTIVSNYSQNSNSKKRLLSSSSSTNLINAHANNQIKNDSSSKQSHSNNQILSIINTNVNINNLNPTNYSKVRMSTNSNARESIQSQKSNGINSRIQTEPSNNEEDVEINYLQTRLSTITKIPSKQSLLNNKSTARRKDNSGSKQNLRDQLQSQEQNQMNQKQNQVTQNQALQGLMINNSYNYMQQKNNDHILNNFNQTTGPNQVKYTENQTVKPVNNQQPQLYFNQKCPTEQSTNEVNDQNKQNSQNFDQIQKIKEYLKQKSAKYPIKQNSISNNQNQYQQMNVNLNQGQQMIQQSSQGNQHNIVQSQIPVKQQQQQQYQIQFQNYNNKGENQLNQQQNSQFNSNNIGQQTNAHYFQKQIR